MEYDPASPTEEPEEEPISLDLSTIPLPGCSPITVSSENVIDIPLPPMDFNTLEIPLPPVVEEFHRSADPPQIVAQPREMDQHETEPSSGPLKFSLRVSSKAFNTDASNEPGVFESSKDLKSDEPRSMPKLQAMMKRSKPSQLPVGVLPSKIKVPVTETKTELFLPSKENDLSDSLLSATEAAKAAAAASGLTLPLQPNIHSGHPATTVPDSGDFQQLLKDIAVNNGHLPSFSSDTISSRSDTSIVSGAVASSTLLTSVSITPHTTASGGAAHIPNLMSLNVTPVTTISLQQTASSLLQDSAAMVRHSKLSLSNMQYVNPQKLRSAQMIATPLIANPAIAAQPHHNDDQSKSRDGRKRSRSRSTRQSRSSRRSRSGRSHSARRSRSRRSRSARRSRSPRRSRSRRRSRSKRRQSPTRRDRRRRSSSSRGSTPRRTIRKYNRRSPSRRSPEDRHKRSRDYSRTRDRRNFDRRRTPREPLNSRYSFRVDKSNLDFRHRSRSSSFARDRRARRRSSSRSRPDKRDPGRHVAVSNRDRSTNNEPDKHSRETSHRRSRGSVRKEPNYSRPADSDKSPLGPEPADARTVTPDAESGSSSSGSSSSRESSSKREDSVDGKARSSVKRRSASPKSEQSCSSSRESSECTGSSGWEVTEAPKSDDESSSTHAPPRHEPKVLSASLPSKTARVGDENGRLLETSSSVSFQPIDDTGGLVPDQNTVSSPCLTSGSSFIHGDQKEFPLHADLLIETQVAPCALPPLRRALDDESPSTTTCGVKVFNADAVGCGSPSSLSCYPIETTTISETVQPFPPPGDARSPRNNQIPLHDFSLFIDCKDEKTLVLPYTDLPVTSAQGSTDLFPSSFVGSPQPAVVPSANLLLGQPRQVSEGKYDLRERKNKDSNRCYEFEHFLSFLPDVAHSWDPPLNAFDAYPDAPKPEYTHVVDNDYSQVDIRSSISSACLVGFSGSAAGRIHEMRCWVCDCTVPSLTDLSNGLYACGPGCINRALNIECGSSCPTGNLCSNRQFQLRLYAPSEPFYCGPGKGWGLRATAEVKKHTFIIEYVGEVIDFPEFRRRVRRYERLRHAHHYFMALGPDRFIDAGSKGNWARFVNHSCEPNCVTQKWSVNGKIRIGFFALEDIASGTELTIDYRFVQFGASEQKCYCGTPSCSGIMGSTSKALQEKIRLKDTTMVERRIMELLQRDAFHRASDITLLLQIMVQECLTRYTRLELLKRLAVTESDACLKLFRQYNGLDMLAAFMCDSAEDDWELKRQILICLEKIPVSEQKQVQTTSHLMDIVTQWTTDPRFCRPRGSSDRFSGLERSVECAHSFDLKPELNSGDNEPSQPTDPCTLERGENGTAYNHDDIPASEVASPTYGLPDSVSTSCASTPNSTQSSVMSHVTTQSASVTLPDFYFSGTLMPTTTQAIVDPDELDSPTVMADCDPNFCAESPDPSCRTTSELPASDLVEEIRQLAANLLDKWSKLPKENYRIPRTERQETEKELHFDLVSSSLVSWGHQDDQKNLYTSWSYPAGAKQSISTRSKRVESTGGELSAPTNESKLSKSERRRLFEAQVKADEAKAEESSSVSGSIPLTTNNDEVNELRQLILCCLRSEIRKSESNGSGDGIASNTAITTVLFNTILQILPVLLSKLSAFKDLSSVTRLCEQMTKQSVDSNTLLPHGWQSAIDPSGRIYYYNMTTKVVQWEQPAINRSDQLGESTVITAEKQSISAKTPLDTASRKKMEKDFTVETGNYVLRLLRPYRLPNCLTGRIESHGDLVHIARKLTHAFVSRELRHSRSSPPKLTQTLQDTIRSSLTRYMTSRGAVYKRRHKNALLHDATNTLSD